MVLSQEFISRIERARNPRCEQLDLSSHWLASDKLTNIPPEIFELTHLRKLNLSGNRLTFLGSEIENLVNLTHLDLRYNTLEKLPQEIGLLTKLLELKLSDNQLITLPTTIGNLINLRILRLDNNQLSSLPNTIINLSQDLKLSVTGNNQLREPPLSVAMKGIPEIQKYFPKDTQDIPRNQVFISFSHQDREWTDQLKIMLKPLMRNQTITVWDDTKIQAGVKRKDEIQKALAAAKVAVLMVSPNFLDSDFIAEHELHPLLQAAEQEGLTIIWVYVSACLYEETEIGDYQAAHDISNPLDSLSQAELNQVLKTICQQIKAAF